MKKQLIWDLPIRLFHWLLVVSLLGQYVTAEILKDAMQWHFYLGYFTLGLMLFRLLWGFIGPQHARFSNFLKGPGAVLHYTKTLFSAESTPYTGHNPVGGWVVVLMLSIVTTQAISGLFLSDDVFMDGPYFHAVSETTQKLMNSIHHQLFNLLLLVIALHVAAIIFYTLVKKQPLASSMVHGKKATPEPGIPSSKLLLALILAALSAAAIFYLVVVAPPLPADDGFY
ncbi:cytochrome B [Alteromonas aestuariivivens]|uniref:Cytochrome B n=1 Tax=Alteromonas aestuariivivens TaxID=1938339 RepID=A0A3D8M4S9_9ALTE|nr:cytochrome b/b6 domain-containing protein [Alteromonas aestuariivivens]RDV24580.1 cytochrome B [Alteromonas aestuariivivens]